ncbi:hypothetical protein EVAR_12264_1 [Eumeta japonica]|uniref:Uncharacterized protein n=1 Tax=Eumeta variegata TaxID=151549 RepID=A0A4C1TUI5_EUMVA|nr:hypothetical protein EVAR_12264_1 [Eumeta japonica]
MALDFAIRQIAVRRIIAQFGSSLRSSLLAVCRKKREVDTANDCIKSRRSDIEEKIKGVPKQNTACDKREEKY